MRFHRVWVSAVAAAMLVAACGGGVDSAPAPSTTATAGDTTVTQGEPAVETTQADASAIGNGATTTTATRPAPDPSREIAPDFSLALADGSTFVLSEETRPVFMVFWAEW